MSTTRFRILLGLFVALLLVGAMSTSVMGQATISTGAIAGIVTDPSGAVVQGAKVVITSKDTGGQISLTSTTTGTFNSGALIPGGYTVRVSHAGFKGVDVPVTVQVGAVSGISVKLPVGTSTEVVEVTASAITVNTEQATVQGVLTTAQIDALPMNGRNFLDLAQLEPGVQIQDGLNFDPTKGGFTGISIGGREGRTTRIELDGQDISDETVGTTTMNLSPSAIQEFSISQSSLDMSTELTSSGAVNVVSRSGTNAYHGEGFYAYRSNSKLAANFPGGLDLPYQRNQEGGRFGGPMVKDKLFFFLNIEHVKQDLQTPVSLSGPAIGHFSGGDPTPFKESMFTGRLDWQFKPNARFFYRFNFDQNKGITNFGFAYSNYAGSNNARAHVWGVDFNTGEWTHSLRVSYLKFVNRIDPNAPSPVVLVPGLTVRLSNFYSGPNIEAPQETFQSNQAGKYDGSRILGNHTFRYGLGVNRIRGGGGAAFYNDYVRVQNNTAGTTYAALSLAGPGGITNPLNYPLYYWIMGNGQGFNTELPAFKEPGGGQYDNRFQFYVGDSWKATPHLTITAALRYVRDTGRTNSDLAPLSCSQIAPSLSADATAAGTPITTCPAGGNLMDMFGPHLGNRIRQDNNNFGPQLGFAWDIFHNGKTVIRGGAGVFFENAIFNNVLFSRSAYLPKGLFFANTPVLCRDTTVMDMPLSGVYDITTNGGVNCGGAAQWATGDPKYALGNQISKIQAVFKQYQSETKLAGPSNNPSFVGNTLSPAFNGNDLLDPNYRTPYSYQMNIGVQRQLSPGAVLSADYIRNVNLHYLMSIDTNQVGNVKYFNKTAALAAISAVNNFYGCGASTAAAATNCAIAAGASIADYADAGLTSGVQLGGGAPSYYGASSGSSETVDPGGAPTFNRYAFGGINPDAGANAMLFPIGRSVYNALQLSLRVNKAHPISFLKSVNLQASYTLSRFDTMVFDQDFIYAATDQQNPNRYFGPTSFDRTHQLSFGLNLEFPKFVKLSLVQHLNSPYPITLQAYNQGRADEIYHTDFTGDGTVGDILPGTNIGTFGRSSSDLGAIISKYNSTVAGKLTPAGQTLVDNGVMTQAQLISLGAVADSLTPPVANYMKNDWLNNTDMRVSFPFKIGERFTIEPSASLFNLFNVANFGVAPYCANNAAGGRLCGILEPALGNTIGYTTKAQANSMRAFQSPSLFNLGSPRQAELQIRVTW
jgi:Carboxypeptidase regulatory-like domain